MTNKGLLHNVAQQTQYFKAIVELSNRVKTTSINAMLLGKRFSVGSSGFAAVSKELKNISDQLIDSSQVISKLLTDFNQLAAEVIKRKMNLQKWKRLSQLAKDSEIERQLNSLYSELTYELIELIETLKKRISAMEKENRSSERFATLAENLTVRSRIETQFAQSGHAALDSINSAMERLFDEIGQNVAEVKRVNDYLDNELNLIMGHLE